jgi:Mrp family chromosome partitioning ATPase
LSAVELSFVIVALRRRLWLVALGALLGLVAALTLTAGKAAEYQAVAELLIQPRTSATGLASSSDPDRFIAGEVASLKGASFAELVAKQVPGTDRLLLANTVQIEQAAKTDVVRIVARLATAELAQKVANAYATTYIAESEKQGNAGYETEIADIDKQLQQLSARISEIEVERAKIPPNSPNVAERTRDAELFQQTSSYRAQYSQLLSTQTNLRYSSTLKSRSEVLQLAPLPTEPVPSSRSMLAIAGGFLGLMLGAVAAVAWANSSRRLLDVVQLEEILGVQAVGTVPTDRGLAENPKVAFEGLPDSTAAVIDQLCVRAEASAQGETDALTIAVVGAQRGAGATTVALAMAGRFARNGARTVVIDADLADPAISRSFAALDDAGIPGLLARLASARKDPVPPGAPQPVAPDSMPSRVFTPTTLPDVRVLGVGAPTKARSLHRTNVDLVIDAAARGGVDVVVIDGGPLLDAASTVRLCQVVDVVVLVVPVRRQSIEPLGVINRLLSYRSGDLLPVATKVTPKIGAHVAAHQPADDSSDVDDIIEAATRGRTGGERARRTPASAAPDSAAGATRAQPVAPPVPASPRLGAPPAPRRRVTITGLDDGDGRDAPAGAARPPVVIPGADRQLPAASHDVEWTARRPEG